MTRTQAIEICTAYRIPRNVDFCTLNSETVLRILEAADLHKYRKPANANGSRGRYFHAFLCRVANRPE